MDWTEITLCVTAVLLGIYYWSTSTFDFWDSRGITGPRPVPLIGNFSKILLGKTSLGQHLKSIYDAYKNNKIIGIYIRREPAIVLTDLDLIKDVLIKDFTTFPDRGFRTFDKAEPLTQHLVNLEPTRWRPLRTKLSPVFTSGKLRNMFYLLLDCGENLVNYLEKSVKIDDTIECRELTAKFTTDVIGTCAFGLRMNALADDNSEFRRMGKYVFSSNWRRILKLRVREYTPWLYEILGRFIVDSRITNFFLNIMRETVEHRKINNIVKHDFIDLIRELRDNPGKVGDIELTDMLLTAQLFVFFLAGFETSATTMSHTLYELAQNQTIQDRVRDEINTHLSNSKSELTYEGVKSMKYLNMVHRETLRKYPPATELLRRSVAPYTFSGTNLTIPTGTKILFPVFAIHRDPRIYPEPEVFDPERFTDEAVAARHPMSWLAFGNGPRNCIGARFANYQSKVGLIKVLQHYKVDVCEKTQIPYAIDPRSFLLAPANGIYLKFSKIP